MQTIEERVDPKDLKRLHQLAKDVSRKWPKVKHLALKVEPVNNDGRLEIHRRGDFVRISRYISVTSLRQSHRAPKGTDAAFLEVSNNGWSLTYRKVEKKRVGFETLRFKVFTPRHRNFMSYITHEANESRHSLRLLNRDKRVSVSRMSLTTVALSERRSSDDSTREMMATLKLLDLETKGLIKLMETKLK